MATSPLVDLLGRLNHVAIATPNIEKAAQFYKNLGANVSDKVVSGKLDSREIHVLCMNFWHFSCFRTD